MFEVGSSGNPRGRPTLILSAKNILPYIYMQEKKIKIGIATIYLSVCTILNTYVHSVHTPINCERNNTVINYFHVIYFFRLTKDDYITYATIFISFYIA